MRAKKFQERCAEENKRALLYTPIDAPDAATEPMTYQQTSVQEAVQSAKKFQERCAEENKRALLYTPIDAPDAATEPMTYQQTSVQEAVQSTFDAIQHMPTPPAWVKTLSFEIGHMKWTMTIHPPGHLHHGQTGDESTAFHSAPINSVDWSTHPPPAG